MKSAPFVARANFGYTMVAFKPLVGALLDADEKALHTK